MHPILKKGGLLLACRKWHYSFLSAILVFSIYFLISSEWNISINDTNIQTQRQAIRMTASPFESSRFDTKDYKQLSDSRQFESKRDRPLKIFDADDAGSTCCPFVDTDPFDEAIMNHFTKRPPHDSSKGLPSVVYVDGDFLRVNFTKVKQQNVTNIEKCRCAVLQLSDENDSKIQRLKWRKYFLHNPLKLVAGDEHVFVECYDNDKTPIAQTYISRIVEKPTVEQRCSENFQRHLIQNKPLETLNVLIVGIDGVSKQSLIRGMPKTRNFILNQLNARELRQFNKVGENTFPNLIALHAGLHKHELNVQYHKWNVHEYFDVVERSFLWHKFQEWGYRTYMGFDVTGTMYHNGKMGFKHPTFDYYNRALSLHIADNSLAKRGGYNCVGQETEAKVLLDYLSRFTSKLSRAKKWRNNDIINNDNRNSSRTSASVSRYKNSKQYNRNNTNDNRSNNNNYRYDDNDYSDDNNDGKDDSNSYDDKGNDTSKVNDNNDDRDLNITPFFAYNFFTRLTHDDPNEISRGDDIYLDFFKQLKEQNVSDNTLVVFLSDHGPRFGPGRQTINGMVETTTPFVFFMFPLWFESKYPDLFAKFTINQDRLTTFFDINKTLLEILHFSRKVGKENDEAQSNRNDVKATRARSLFGQIPASRTCRDADIPEEFCNKRKFSEIDVKSSEDGINECLAKSFFNLIVSITITHRDICAELSLKTVRSIFKITLDTDQYVSKTGSFIKSEFYQVTLETEPGGGIYEAVLEYDRANHNSSVVGEIQRLNFYRHQDYCLQIHDLKPYCFCLGKRSI